MATLARSENRMLKKIRRCFLLLLFSVKEGAICEPKTIRNHCRNGEDCGDYLRSILSVSKKSSWIIERSPGNLPDFLEKYQIEI